MTPKKYKYKLYGAILGDLAGQPFEFGWHPKKLPKKINLHNPKSVITDDTLMTLATAKSIMQGAIPEHEYKEMGKKYPGDHYGKGFKAWLGTPLFTPNDSYGNGCIMRISPYMYLPDSLPQVLDSVLCSHRHEASIRSALKLYDAYKKTKFDYESRAYITNRKRFQVEADSTVDLCLAMYDAMSFQSTQRKIDSIIRLAGGDTDTNASILGELSNYYLQDITQDDAKYVESKLDPYLLKILRQFNKIY